MIRELCPWIKKWLEQPSCRLLWVIGLSGLAFRVVFVLLTQDIGGTAALDAATYNGIAVNLIEGRGFSQDGINPNCFVAPLYPFFLAALYTLAGVQPLLVELLQALLGTLTAWVLYRLVHHFFGHGPALIAFVLALFMPELVVLNTFLYTESLFIFLFITTIWLTIRAWEQPTWGRLALAGVVTALATLTRGVTMFMPLLLGLAALLRFGFRNALRQVLIFSLFFVLPIIPWAIRNYLVFDAVVPVAVGTGDVMWTGNYLPLDGKFSYEKTMALMDSMTVGMNMVEREQRLRQEALKNMKAQPWATLGLMGRKFLRFWFWVYESAPTGAKRQSGTMIQMILAAVYYPVLVLSLAGMWLSRRRWREMFLLHLLLWYYVALHVVMLVVPRYRIPILPLLVLYTSLALWKIWQEWQHRRVT